MAVAPEFFARPTTTEPMGEVWADVLIENYGDIVLAEYGETPPDSVRRLDLRLLIDTGCRSMLLPRRVAERLGLRTIDRTRVLYADGRREDLDVAELVRVTVAGRSAAVAPTVAPAGNVALLGQVVLEITDLLVDCAANALVPRVEGITTQTLL